MQASQWTVGVVLYVLLCGGVMLPPGPALAGTGCNFTLYPNCSAGDCPLGQRCVSSGATCQCQQIACGDAAPACAGAACPSGHACFPNQQGCVCLPTGCCELSANQCIETTQAACDDAGGTFTADAACADDNACAQHTPTAIPTRTPAPNGGACIEHADCASRNCVNGICASQVPAISTPGMAIGLAILIALGALGTWRIRQAAAGQSSTRFQD